MYKYIHIDQYMYVYPCTYTHRWIHTDLCVHTHEYTLLQDLEKNREEAKMDEIRLRVRCVV